MIKVNTNLKHYTRAQYKILYLRDLSLVSPLLGLDLLYLRFSFSFCYC